MRDSCIVYRSFFEAIESLPKEFQADAWSALFNFSLNDKEVDLQGVAKTVFILIKPLLEANNKRFLNGKEPKRKRSRSKTEAKRKQPPIESPTNANKDKDKDVNKDDNENPFSVVLLYLNEKCKRTFEVVEGNCKHIRARLKEGRTLEDLKAVIDCKNKEWGGDAKMKKYLRPATLFNSEKFDGYLQESKINGDFRPSQNNKTHEELWNG